MKENTLSFFIYTICFQLLFLTRPQKSHQHEYKNKKDHQSQINELVFVINKKIKLKIIFL